MAKTPHVAKIPTLTLVYVPAAWKYVAVYRPLWAGVQSCGTYVGDRPLSAKVRSYSIYFPPLP